VLLGRCRAPRRHVVTRVANGPQLGVFTQPLTGGYARDRRWERTRERPGWTRLASSPMPELAHLPRVWSPTVGSTRRDAVWRETEAGGLQDAASSMRLNGYRSKSSRPGHLCNGPCRGVGHLTPGLYPTVLEGYTRCLRLPCGVRHAGHTQGRSRGLHHQPPGPAGSGGAARRQPEPVSGNPAHDDVGPTSPGGA